MSVIDLADGSDLAHCAAIEGDTAPSMAKRKISYPVYRQPAQVTFGTGSARTLAEPEMADGAVFLTSAQASVREVLRAVFERQGRDFDAWPVLEKPAGEPTQHAVTAAAGWLQKQAPTRIVAVGGGSVMDWARLAYAGAAGWLNVETGQVSAPSASWTRPEIVLVPTTCGSGAEAAGVAVYLADGQKRPVVAPQFIADRVVLDGQFLSKFDACTLAPFLCDALSHAIESFVSIVPGYLAKQGAISAFAGILANREGADSCARDRLMEAGYLAGVAASNCSVGVVHAFAHALAAFDVPHGVANGIGLRAGIAANAGTDEMGVFIRRTGFASVDELLEAFHPIVSAALASESAAGAHAAVTRHRGRVLTSMEADVCLRTNPRRLQRDELEVFLDHVVSDLDRP